HASLPLACRAAARAGATRGPRSGLDPAVSSAAGEYRMAAAPSAGRQRLGASAGTAGRLAAPPRRGARRPARLAVQRPDPPPGPLLRATLAVGPAGGTR